MAKIGLKLALFAPITQENANAAPTYGDIVTVGKMISAKTTWDKAEATLYADDQLVENDNVVTGGTIEVNVDDITPEARVAMLGVEEVAGTGSEKTYREIGKSAPNGGFGYVRQGTRSGKAYYVGYVDYKVRFGLEDDEATTKGENVEYQTSTTSGKISAAFSNTNGDPVFRESTGELTTFAAAETWVRTKLGATA